MFIITRSLRPVRVHVNLGYGTYWVRTPVAGDAGGPVIPDPPCTLVPDAPDLPVFGACTASVSRMPFHEVVDRQGRRAFAGLAVDRAIPLRSVLLVGDVFAERYRGPLGSTDWTGELALRWQVTARSVVSAGVGRRFAGNTRAWSVSLGMATSLVSRMLIPETR
jgi:hypothetical protein